MGTPIDPLRIAIAAPRASEVFVARRNRSRVSLSTSFLDFATFDDREGRAYEDTLFVFEADFFYRLHTRIHGIRVGLGVLDGRGGVTNPSDPGAEPARAGFNYGYTELDLRVTPTVALLPRLIAGIGREGLGFGAEGRVRLDEEERTNLTLGVSTLAEVGSPRARGAA